MRLDRSRALVLSVAALVACLPDFSGPALCNEDGSGATFCETYTVTPSGPQGTIFLRGDSLLVASAVETRLVASRWTIVGDALIAGDGSGTTRTIPSAAVIMIRGIAAGSGTVTATYRTQTRTVQLRVADSSAVASILVLDLSNKELRVGDSVLIGASLRTVDERFIIGSPTSWATTDSLVATFARDTTFADGWLHGHSVGTVTLTATFRTIQGSRTFTIVP